MLFLKWNGESSHKVPDETLSKMLLTFDKGCHVKSRGEPHRSLYLFTGSSLDIESVSLKLFNTNKKMTHFRIMVLRAYKALSYGEKVCAHNILKKSFLCVFFLIFYVSNM